MEQSSFIDEYFEQNPLTLKQVDALQWELQQQEVQLLAEFETRAAQYRDFLRDFATNWKTEMLPSIESLFEHYKSTIARLEGGLESPECTALQTVIRLEQERRDLLAQHQSLQASIVWQRAFEAAEAALDAADLDAAQTHIEELNGMEHISRSELEQLERIRQRFVALVRSTN